MKRMFAAIVLTASLAFAAPSVAQDKLAVIEVATVVAKSNEFDALKKAWEVKAKDLADQEAKLKTELQNMQESRDKTLTAGSPEFNKMTLDILRKQNEGGFQLQLDRAMLMGEQKMTVNALFGKVKKAVEALANERGYTLVINDYKPSITEQAVNEMNINQFVSLLLQSSTIMFSNTDANITDAVINKLNADYSETAPTSTKD